MLNLFAIPFAGGKMIGRGGMMGWGETGPFSYLYLTYHIIVGILFLALLILAVVYLWKKIELMDHDMNHHRNHK